MLVTVDAQRLKTCPSTAVKE